MMSTPSNLIEPESVRDTRLRAVEEGRLAAAVGTDEPHHLAGADADVYPVHGGQTAEPLHDAAGIQQCGHGSFPGSPRRALRPSHRCHITVTEAPLGSTIATRPLGTNRTITIRSAPWAIRW